MVHIIDGQAAITIEGKPHTVKKGEFIIMPAGKVHALRAVRKFKMALIMIRG
jgi:quercetin dioxygenase-like cupin family protein